MQQCLEVGAVGAPYLFKRVLQCLVGPGREQSLCSVPLQREPCVCQQLHTFVSYSFQKPGCRNVLVNPWAAPWEHILDHCIRWFSVVSAIMWETQIEALGFHLGQSQVFGPIWRGKQGQKINLFCLSNKSFTCVLSNLCFFRSWEL